MNVKRYIAAALLLACGRAHAETINLDPEFLTTEQLEALDQEQLFTDSISQSVQANMPSPLTFDTESPAYAYDFAFFTVAVKTSASFTRSNYSGAVLISPSRALVASHTPGDGGSYVWKRKDTGAEETRTRVDAENVSFAGTDLSVIKLNSPITTITPVAIMANVDHISGRYGFVIDVDRHLRLSATSWGASTAGWTPITNARADACFGRDVADGDSITGNESGKPGVVIVDGRPVLVMTGVRGSATAGDWRWLVGQNASHYLEELQEILDEDGLGEELTLVEFLDPPEPLTPPSSAPPESPPLSPGRYHLQSSAGAMLTAGGLHLKIDVEEEE
jgi:hypothetical protein